MRAALEASATGVLKSTSSAAARSERRELLGDGCWRYLLHCSADLLSGPLLDCSSGNCCA